MPLVSVVIPAYNASKYIEETVRSVLSQTISDFEIIIVNDGSKDNTLEVLNSFLTDSRISVFSQENAGVCNARNFGLSKAKGKYIALLDADDTFLERNLEKKIAALENNSAADWVFSNLRITDENSNITKAATAGKGENVLENILLWNGEVIPGPCSNLLFRKKIIEDGMVFDPGFSTAADQDFCLKLAANYKYAFLEDVLGCYRFLNTGMSRNISLMEKDHIGVYKKAEKNNFFSSSRFRRKCFSNLYLILAGSWWVNGKNKKRGIYFICKSIFIYPPNILKLIQKLF